MGREESMMVGFTIVAIAGDAKTSVIKAIESAKIGKFDDAENYLKEANEHIAEAHREQTSILQKEAQGESEELSFIMMHGQDSLMTTMILRDTAKYIIDLYKEINELKK